MRVPAYIKRCARRRAAPRSRGVCREESIRGLPEPSERETSALIDLEERERLSTFELSILSVILFADCGCFGCAQPASEDYVLSYDLQRKSSIRTKFCQQRGNRRRHQVPHPPHCCPPYCLTKLLPTKLLPTILPPTKAPTLQLSNAALSS